MVMSAHQSRFATNKRRGNQLLTHLVISVSIHSIMCYNSSHGPQNIGTMDGNIIETDEHPLEVNKCPRILH